MFLQNVSFFCGFVTYSDVNFNRDIKFCFNCGMSLVDVFCSDSLTSSLVLSSW